MQHTGERRRWLMLVVLFVARVALGFQFQSVASTGSMLIADFGIGYADLGALIGVYMLPGVVIALPGGLLGHRFGDKAVCASGLALMVVGGIVLGLADGYGMAVAGRLLSGIGGVLFSLVLTKMATDWFAEREIVFAMAVILASWPFGIAAGLLAQGVIARAEGWRAAIHLATAICVLAFALLTGLYRSPVRMAARPNAAPGRGLPPWRMLAPVIVAGIGWGFFNVGFVLFFSFVPLLLGEQGIAPLLAASWASMALWICMASIPLGGYLAQRSGRPDVAILIFCCALAAAMALLAGAGWPLLLCIAFGLLIGPPPGALMALPARVLSPETRVAGLGVFFTCFYAVFAVGPLFAGLLRDLTGSAAAPVLFGGLTSLAVIPCTLGFQLLDRWRRGEG